MGKYTALQNDIFSVFDSPTWEAEAIKTYPSDFVAANPGTEFVRVSTTLGTTDLRDDSVQGLLSIDIFTPAGFGPKRSNEIADKLDKYLAKRSYSLTTGGNTQFELSSLQAMGKDPDNPSLSRSRYQIPFKFYWSI
jgi:hypothetical protein